MATVTVQLKPVFPPETLTPQTSSSRSWRRYQLVEVEVNTPGGASLPAGVGAMTRLTVCNVHVVAGGNKVQLSSGATANHRGTRDIKQQTVLQLDKQNNEAAILAMVGDFNMNEVEIKEALEKTSPRSGEVFFMAVEGKCGILVRGSAANVPDAPAAVGRSAGGASDAHDAVDVVLTCAPVSAEQLLQWHQWPSVGEAPLLANAGPGLRPPPGRRACTRAAGVTSSCTSERRQQRMRPTPPPTQ